MGLTYATGANLLNYLYNDEDFYGSQRTQNDPIPTFSSFVVELTKSNGDAYSEGVQNESLIRGFGSTSWNINANIVTNAIDLTFPPKTTSGSETITGFTLKIDGISVGASDFATGTLNTPITVQQGETPIIRVYNASSGDGLEINIDNNSMYGNNFKQKIYKYLFLAEDSLSSISQYKFTPFNNSLAQLFNNLSFFVARVDENSPGGVNWSIVNQSGYAQAFNTKELILPLNQDGDALFNRVNIYYLEGTFPNETYVFAGNFITTQISSVTPTNYTIADGETGRFVVGQLRINSK